MYEQNPSVAGCGLVYHNRGKAISLSTAAQLGHGVRRIDKPGEFKAQERLLDSGTRTRRPIGAHTIEAGAGRNVLVVAAERSQNGRGIWAYLTPP